MDKQAENPVLSELANPDDYSYVDNDCPCFISITVMKCPNKRQLRGENSHLSYNSRFQIIMVGKSRQDIPTASYVTTH